MIPGITALENVMVPALPTGERHADLKARALGALGKLGLEAKAGSRVEWRSGGVAQRVTIARALVNDPAVIIADEPTAHLDTRLSAEFMSTVAELKRLGKTVLLASHDPLVFGAGVVDRVVTVVDGRGPALPALHRGHGRCRQAPPQPLRLSDPGPEARQLLPGGPVAVWNATDNRAHDYPLIRAKYGLLRAMTPLVLAEAVFQGAFFPGLRADLITSCCGTLFSGEGRGLTSDLAAAPLGPNGVAFFAVLGATVLLAPRSRRAPGLRYAFSVLSAGSFLLGLLAVVSFVSIYVYELPTHNCPFCLLQAEYGAVGYPFYGALLGAVEPFRAIPSLREVVSRVQDRLTAAAALFGVGLAVAAWALGSSGYTP